MTASSFLRKIFVVVAVLVVAVVPGRISLSDNYTANCRTFVASNQSRVCPTWYVPNFEIKDRCDCGEDFYRSVKCYPNSNSSLRTGFCMTYNKTSRLTSVGSCPYNTNQEIPRFYPLPEDVLQLNEQMCGPLNRTGLLCSQCQQGLGPAVFSPYRECLECMDEPYGWILFFFLATFPQTILCLFVIIFRINAASPSLNGFVLAAQIITNSINTTPSSGFVGKFVATCYGFWNLDFISYILPPFCIKEGMGTLTVMALEYTVALYPIFFTVVVYYCITLHDNGCRLLVCCWKPFHWFFARFRGTWELKGSVINAFATILLLSYSKLCSISVGLLQSSKLIDVCSGGYRRVYYDASYEMFSKHHLPHVVLASIIMIIFVCLPAIFVLFYQSKVLQKCLNFCNFKCVLIHELANICQGCFKNGTSPGTGDYRWFAGLYLLLRIFFTVIVNQKDYHMYMILVPCIMAVLVAIVRPYRIDVYNKLDSILWLDFAIRSSWLVNIVAYEDHKPETLYIFVCIPLVYLFGYVALRSVIFIVKKCRSQIAKRKKLFITESEGTNTQDNGDDQLPDRLLQPSEYTPLLSASKRLSLNSNTQLSVQSNDTY